MVEADGYRIGHLRMKYIDLANMAFAQNNYLEADRHIKSFLDTIKDDSKAASLIKTEFDRVNVRRKKTLEELQNNTENLGYLEQKDIVDEGRTSIEINFIHDKKEICHMIALKEGLFYD